MFLKIDEWLIMWADWCVRQCELYSGMTKKSIGDFWLFLLKCSVLCMMLGTVLYLAIEVNGLGYLFVVCFLTQVMNYFTLKKYLQISDSVNNARPAAIITRRVGRYILLCVLGYIVPSWTMFIVIQEDFSVISTTNYVIAISNTAILINLVVSAVLEYLLCVTPMPPREKQRHAYERERRVFMT